MPIRPITSCASDDYLGSQNGLPPETTVDIKIRDIDRNHGYPWIVRPKHAKSSETGYITFADEECGEAMLVYWKSRKVEDPYFYIFTSEYKPTQKVSAPDYSDAIQRVKKRAVAAGTIRSEVRPYGLRKLFQTEFERARVSPNWIKLMMCHSIGDVETAYSQAELDDMREAIVPL